MTPELWKRVEQLYYTAIELSEAEREPFLARECGADAPLRNEINSLLRQDSTPQSILDVPAIDAMARLLAVEERRIGAELLAGATISHYRVLEAIGEGGMGVVYLAEDLRLGRRVALKLLPTYLASDQQALERFQREAQAASALNHPSICTVYEIDEVEGRPFIAIEHLEGETLKERLARGPMPVSELLRIGVEICGGLQAAHASDIVHRDVKPANVMLTRQGGVKILDFGVAKRGGVEPVRERPLTAPPATDEAAPDLTTPGAALGTASYMSPEQANGDSVDSRSDIYSLGVVLYEMATGGPPFVGRSTRELVSAICTQPVPAIEVANPRAPAQLGRIVARAMHKDRTQRFQQVAQLRTALQSLQHSLESTGRKRRAVLVVAGLLALTAGLVTVGMHDARVRSWIRGAGRGPEIKSIAVLPFGNPSGDAQQEYLVDGMSAALVTDLARLGIWRVISSSSSMLYKGSGKPLTRIAHELGVNALVTGTVARAGNRIRVSARLVEGQHEKTLWEAAYERDWQDVLKLQEDLAVALAYHATDKMSPELQAKLAGKSQAVRPEAYEAYLRAEYFYSKEDAAGFEKANQYYRRAIELDPAFAPAYVGLAQNYAFQAYTNRLRPDEAYVEAEKLLARALQLDPGFSFAHVQVGMIQLFYRCDLAAAEREINRALALDPGDIGALDYHSYYLLEMGRFDEAIAEKKIVLASDPVSVGTNSQLGMYLTRGGRNAEAITQLRRTLELDPDHAPALARLGLAYANAGQYALAVEQLKHAAAIEPFPPRLGALGEVYARWGKRPQALEVIRDLKDLMPQRYVPPPLIALIYARLGERETALQWLARARIGDRPTVADPGFDSLRSDARFAAQAARLAPAGACARLL